MILIGVLVLIVMIPTGTKETSGKSKLTGNKSNEKNTQEYGQADGISDSEYVEQLEEQIRILIEQMDGCGKANVMITLSDDGQTYLDKNCKTDEKAKEETTVIYDTGEEQKPYVIRKERPHVEGMVIVVQGGNSPAVVTEITDAMMSLFDIEAHKIKVVKMSGGIAVKKIVHKNQIVITTLAVLIAIAGYVTYDKKNADPKEEQVVTSVNANDAASDKESDFTTDIASDISDGETVATASTQEVNNPGETVLTSALVQDADYVAKVKLNREQVRSKNKESLQAIIDNETLDDAQKKAAVDEMITLTDIAEKESNAEMMLEAKGFTDVVVSISEDACDVVLNMGDVTDAKRAQVEDIVKRKTGVAAENIVITPIE